MKNKTLITLLLAISVTIMWHTDAHALFGNDSDLKLFGKSESKSSRLRPFPKWLNMLSREKNNPSKNLVCKPHLFNECNLEKVSDLNKRLQGLPIIEQLKQVNHYMNESRYLADPSNWGVPDYWETPAEFFRRRGDCEDYAIVKYITLKRLGIDPSSMRIVVLMDNNLRVHHSVLAVYANDTIYILDNQIKQVLEHFQIYHYEPIFSINEKYWWRYR